MIHNNEWKKDGWCIGILVVCFCFGVGLLANQQRLISEKLRPTVLRFHVLADSDEVQAQYLKLQVRDAMLEKIRPWLEDIDSREEAIQIIMEHCEELEQCGEEVLSAQGCELPVRAELTQSYFPVRQYGKLLVPAGEYETLRVTIGEAQGKNWWCMLFPGLCFVEGTYQIEGEELETLKEVLTEDELQTIWEDDKMEVEIKFWLWEKVSRWIQKRKI